MLYKLFKLLIFILSIYGWVLISTVNTDIALGLLFIGVLQASQQVDRDDKLKARIKELEETLIEHGIHR